MKRFLFLFLSLCLILTGCTAPVPTIELKDTPPPSPSASPLLAAPTDAPVESPSIPDPVFSEETASPSVSPTPVSTPDQPPLLSRLLEQQNLTFDDLSFDQLVLVAADRDVLRPVRLRPRCRRCLGQSILREWTRRPQGRLREQARGR